jgi:FAD/FMN-containing dehydrogenase
LNRTLTYEPDDLTIGVEAGMRLGALQAALAANGQFLPLDGPSDAPIGALVAAAVDSPRRLGYGTMRDWVLALSVVEADGVVSRLGAQVVKNVTGYDLVKLFVGSRDSLGLIATVSLRVFPLPPASATCVACFPNRAAVFACLDALVASRLQPSAAELLEGLSLPQPVAERAAGCTLLAVRCVGRPAAVARHLRELAAITARHGAVERWTLEDDEELALWSVVAAHGAAVVESGQALVRIATPPAELSPALDHAAARALALGVERVISARAISGVALLRLRGEAAALRQWLLEMVQQLRHVHLLAGLDGLRRELPAWGVAPPGLELMVALKVALDPDNSFGPPPFTA